METITISKSEYEQQQARILKLEHELAWLKRQLFGQKSERFVTDDTQLSLDLGLESAGQDEVQTQEISYTRTTRKNTEGHGRSEMPTHLPFENITVEPEQSLDGCDKLGEEVTWEYEYTPGTLFVRRFIRPKYRNPHTNEIIIASLPQRPVEKGNFGPGFMSTVTTDKYLYHAPLNRQREKFKNEFRVAFAESTFCDIIARTVFWLEPIYRLQKSELLKASYIQADETPIPVLIKNKKGKTHKGFYWVYFDPVRKIVVFEYRTGRSRAGPNEFLKSFNGILQVDGYTGYDEVIRSKGITRAACMAHVRRKFENALDYDKAAAEYALQAIGQWFSLERECRESHLSFEQRYEKRNAIAASQMSEFKTWLLETAQSHMPQSPIRKACEYALGQWDGFKAYLDDGRVELSNNLVENAIRPVALGRKNYLFKGSESAAQRGAVIYSIIATAKLHDKEPRDYIKSLLNQLPAENSKNIEKYLPWNL